MTAARFILACRYLKAGNTKQMYNFVKYIATRDGVETQIAETAKKRPATEKQKTLIAELKNSFPSMEKSLEYQDYLVHPNRATASELITQTLDYNFELVAEKENFVHYMGKRPGVEKHAGAHGLFSSTQEPIDLGEVAQEVANHKGNIWTMVLSLRREDAQRLSFDHAAAWQNLLKGQQYKLAEVLKIPGANLKWYAAFHNEGHHPHIHLMAYSTDPKEGFLSAVGIENFKESCMKEIFANDLQHIYAQRDTLRNELNNKMQDTLLHLQRKDKLSPTLQAQFLELTNALQKCKGKKQYGWLSAHHKKLVDSIVEELAHEPEIAALYHGWCQTQEELQSFYRADMKNPPALVNIPAFRKVKNIVVAAAAKYNPKRGNLMLAAAPTTEESNQDDYHTKIVDSSLASAVIKLCYQTGQIIYTDYAAMRKKHFAALDRKELEKLAQKKIAQGQKL